MKNALSIIALGGIALFFFTKKKVRDLQHIMDNIKVRLSKVSNFRVSGGRILFTADVVLVNPTTDSIGFNTFDQVSLKQLQFFDDNGNHIGTADTHFFKLTIPANSETALPQVNVDVPIGQLVISIAFNQLKNLKVSAELDVVGTSYIINQQL